MEAPRSGSLFLCSSSLVNLNFSVSLIKLKSIFGIIGIHCQYLCLFIISNLKSRGYKYINGELLFNIRYLYDEDSKAQLNGLIGRLGLEIFEANLPNSGT